MAISIPTLFWVAAAIYLVSSIISAVALRQRWVGADLQAASQSLLDIGAVVVLMHASGGIASGLGGLLIVFVGAASLVLPRRFPLVLAAIATFAILGQQVLAQLGNVPTDANYPAAGILSAVIFAMALATRPLGRRIQASEALARQRGVDLQNLSELNEYIVQHLRESIIVIDIDDQESGSAMPPQHALAWGNRNSPQVPLGNVFEPLADYIRDWRTIATNCQPTLSLRHHHFG